MSIEEKIKTAKEDSWLKDSVSEKEFKEIKDNERRMRGGRMTKEEAIEVLKAWDGYFIGYNSDEVNEALNMAIKALQENPKLIEEVKKWKTYFEVALNN